MQTKQEYRAWRALKGTEWFFQQLDELRKGITQNMVDRSQDTSKPDLTHGFMCSLGGGLYALDKINAIEPERDDDDNE